MARGDDWSCCLCGLMRRTGELEQVEQVRLRLGTGAGELKLGGTQAVNCLGFAGRLYIYSRAGQVRGDTTL